MYTDLKSLWYGWTKNAYALVECRMPYLLLVLFLINSVFLGPVFHSALLLFPVFNISQSADVAIVTACLLVEIVTLIFWLEKQQSITRGLSGITYFFYQQAAWL